MNIWGFSLLIEREGQREWLLSSEPRAAGCGGYFHAADVSGEVQK